MEFRRVLFRSVSYGRDVTSQVEVAAGAADDSGFSVRLSGLYQHRDDWVDNIATTKKDDLGGYDDIAARLQLQYESGPFTGRVTGQVRVYDGSAIIFRANTQLRSEEHTSELQSLMRISYAVFCLKKQ